MRRRVRRGTDSDHLLGTSRVVRLNRACLWGPAVLQLPGISPVTKLWSERREGIATAKRGSIKARVAYGSSTDDSTTCVGGSPAHSRFPSPEKRQRHRGRRCRSCALISSPKKRQRDRERRWRLVDAISSPEKRQRDRGRRCRLVRAISSPEKRQGGVNGRTPSRAPVQRRSGELGVDPQSCELERLDPPMSVSAALVRLVIVPVPVHVLHG